MDYKNDLKNIETERELEFAVFCIENVALKLGKTGEEIYKVFTKEYNILNQYIIPCYDVLHTQGKDYIVEEIIEVMKERGVDL